MLLVSRDLSRRMSVPNTGDDDQMNVHKELGGSEQKVSKLLKW